MASFLIPVTLAVLVGQAAAALTLGRSQQQSLEEIWSAESSTVNPVKRVLGLLNKMKSELEAEAAKESEMFDRMTCFCETNKKEKTAAVAKADRDSEDLEAEISSRSASNGGLSAQIASLKKQIEKDETTLKEERALYEKLEGELKKEEVETLDAITNLKNALGVLKCADGTGFNALQLDPSTAASMRAVLRDLSTQYAILLADHHKAGGAALLQSPRATEGGLSADLLQALNEEGGAQAGEELPLSLAKHALKLASAASAKEGKVSLAQVGAVPWADTSYNTRSGQICGILSQMHEEMEGTLSEAQKEAAAQKTRYQDLKAAKSGQIEAGKANLDSLQQQNADNEKALSDAKESLESTRQARTADVEFLQKLTLQCQQTDKDWEERSATRAAETKAVAEAIAILMEDENLEIRNAASFLQESSTAEVAAQRVVRSQAATWLRQQAAGPAFQTDDLLAAWQGRGAAVALQSPRTQLSTLAVSVQLKPFTKVKAMMDKMVADLKKQQAAEVQDKADCGSELDTNEKMTYAKNQEKNDHAANIESLAASIEKLNGEIAAANAEIAENGLNIKKASQTREEENSEFQQTVSDQRGMQSVMNKVLTRLKQFYNRPRASLMQRVSNAIRQKQAPPEKFNKYKENAGSVSVLSMLEQIVGDSKTLEAEAITGEKEAQADYESFVKSTNDATAGLQQDVTRFQDAVASATQDKEQATGDHDSAVSELEGLSQVNADLHEKCDFLLKNFKIRQAARLQEMEAIQQAKAILSGSR